MCLDTLQNEWIGTVEWQNRDENWNYFDNVRCESIVPIENVWTYHIIITCVRFLLMIVRRWVHSVAQSPFCVLSIEKCYALFKNNNDQTKRYSKSKCIIIFYDNWMWARNSNFQLVTYFIFFSVINNKGREKERFGECPSVQIQFSNYWNFSMHRKSTNDYEFMDKLIRCEVKMHRPLWCIYLFGKSEWGKIKQNSILTISAHKIDKIMG